MMGARNNYQWLAQERAYSKIFIECYPSLGAALLSLAILK